MFVSTVALLIQMLYILFSKAKEPSGSACIHTITGFTQILLGQLLKVIKSKISLCSQWTGPLKIILMVPASCWVIIHTFEPIGK